MFDGAAAFNGDVSKWDVGNVTDMTVSRVPRAHPRRRARAARARRSSGAARRPARCDAATALRPDACVVGCPRSPQAMFQCAAAFNGDVSKWDVGNVTTMEVSRYRARPRRRARVARARRSSGAGAAASAVRCCDGAAA